MSPTTPSRAGRPRVVAAIVTAGALLLAACGVTGGSDSASSTSSGATAATTTTAPLKDPAETLQAAADATLEASSFEVDVDANLEIGLQTVHLTSTGRIDYDKIVSDVTIEVDQSGVSGSVDIRADGTSFWVRSNQKGGPKLPAGKTWVQGPVSRLKKSSTLQPSGLVGVVLALLGTKDANLTGSAKVGGVAVRKYETTILYRDAVKAAGDRADAFQSALSLKGDPDIKLDTDVAIGEDGIIRQMSIDINASQSSIALNGTYEVDLRNVNKPVQKPEVPPAGQTVTGPAADRLLDQLIN